MTRYDVHIDRVVLPAGSTRDPALAEQLAAAVRDALGARPEAAADPTDAGRAAYGFERDALSSAVASRVARVVKGRT